MVRVLVRAFESKILFDLFRVDRESFQYARLGRSSSLVKVSTSQLKPKRLRLLTQKL